jgi:hypothetical protein
VDDFERWLGDALARADYGLLRIADVVAMAADDLDLGREDILRRLAALTARGSRFISDGQFVREGDRQNDRS